MKNRFWMSLAAVPFCAILAACSSTVATNSPRVAPGQVPQSAPSLQPSAQSPVQSSVSVASSPVQSSGPSAPPTAPSPVRPPTDGQGGANSGSGNGGGNGNGGGGNGSGNGGGNGSGNGGNSNGGNSNGGNGSGSGGKGGGAGQVPTESGTDGGLDGTVSKTGTISPVLVVTLRVPSTCKPGQRIMPTVAWRSANAQNVVVNIDNPGGLGNSSAGDLGPSGSAPIEDAAISCQPDDLNGKTYEHDIEIAALGAKGNTFISYHVVVTVNDPAMTSRPQPTLQISVNAPEYCTAGATVAPTLAVSNTNTKEVQVAVVRDGNETQANLNNIGGPSALLGSVQTGIAELNFTCQGAAGTRLTEQVKVTALGDFGNVTKTATITVIVD